MFGKCPDIPHGTILKYYDSKTPLFCTDTDNLSNCWFCYSWSSLPLKTGDEIVIYNRFFKIPIVGKPFKVVYPGGSQNVYLTEGSEGKPYA